MVWACKGTREQEADPAPTLGASRPVTKPHPGPTATTSVPTSRPGPTSPGARTCCAACAEPAGPAERRHVRSSLGHVTALPPARRFHTSATNQGKGRARPRPTPAGLGRRPCPAAMERPRVRAPLPAAGHARPGWGADPRVWGVPPSRPADSAGGAGDSSQLPGTGGAAMRPERRCGVCSREGTR